MSLTLEIIAALMYRPRSIPDLMDYSGAGENGVRGALDRLRERGLVRISGRTRNGKQWPAVYSLQVTPFAEPDIPPPAVSRTVEYQAWNHMRHKLKLCDSWERSYEQFRSYLGQRPPGNFRLARNDTDRPYGPGNAHWQEHK